MDSEGSQVVAQATSGSSGLAISLYVQLFHPAKADDQTSTSDS